MTKVTDSFVDPNAPKGKVESTGWPSYRYNPETGEKRVFQKESDVPAGWTDKRPKSGDVSPPAEANDAFLAQLTKVEDERDVALAEKATAENELEEARAEINRLRGELEDAKAQITELSKDPASADAASLADAIDPPPKDCKGSFKQLDMTRKQIMDFLRDEGVAFGDKESNDQLAARALAVDEAAEDEESEDDNG